MNARRNSRDESEIAKEMSLAFGERARVNDAERAGTAIVA